MSDWEKIEAGGCAPPILARRTRPYTTREVAELIGRSVDRLLRTYEGLHRLHNMPLPLAGRPYRWDRATFDLWRAGRLPRAAANDASPAAIDDDTQRAALHQAYGRRRSA